MGALSIYTWQDWVLLALLAIFYVAVLLTFYALLRYSPESGHRTFAAKVGYAVLGLVLLLPVLLALASLSDWLFGTHVRASIDELRLSPEGPGIAVFGGLVLLVGLGSVGLALGNRRANWEERFKHIRAAVLWVLGGTAILLTSPWLKSRLGLALPRSWQGFWDLDKSSSAVVLSAAVLATVLALSRRRR